MAQIDYQQLPEWAAIPVPDIIDLGAPRQYRFDGRLGCFSRGQENMGAVLEVRPLLYRWHESERWGRPRQNWFDLAFVDGSNCVSVLSLKKDSALAIWEYIADISTNGFDYRLGRLVLEAVQCDLLIEQEDGSEVEGEPYYVIQVGEFQACTEAQYLATRSWLQQRETRFEWILVGEVEDAGAA